MKKIMSLLMAIVMVFCLATPVKAADYTIEAPTNGHTYEIYQIFTGDYSTEKDTLSNIKWGANGTGTKDEKVSEEVLNALLEVNGKSDTEKLAVIERYAKLVNPFKTLKDGEVSVPAGYYLIKDINDALDGKHDAYTKYIVEVVKDVTISPKSVFPTVDKLVHDEPADAEDLVTDGWNETADHNLNESFQFKLIANLPIDKDYNAYSEYKVVFYDEMSTGISFEGIESVQIIGKDSEGTDKTATLTEEQYKLSEVVNQKFTVTIANAKVYGVDLTKGATIEVIYNAHLNNDAVIGNEDDNKNTVYLEYSNNPNAGGEGDFGRTPTDTVWVFTYEVNGLKIGNDKDEQGNNTKLKDAEFVLYREEGSTKYYVQLNGDKEVTGWTTSKDAATKIVSGLDGTFKVIGLDHGTYKLEETLAPDGYNLLDGPVNVVITAEHEEAESKDTATTIIEVNGIENGTVEVENKKGITLPSTGGIGTTLFYVFGGLLFAGAVVLLITKKRMNEE